MKISIITINRNNKAGLAATIESVVSQTCFDMIEYIVVDGASDDGSEAVIKSHVEKLSFWVSEPDSGVYDAMNKGTKHATGDYVLYLNSGDCLSSCDVIENVIQAISSNGEVEDGRTIYIGYVNHVNSDHEVTYVQKCNLDSRALWDYIYFSIPHQASFIPRMMVQNHPYDESYKICADFKFFMEMIYHNNAKVQIIDTLVADFDATGISSVDRIRLFDEKERSVTEVFPASLVSDIRILQPYWQDRYRIKWVYSHPFAHRLYQFMTAIGMRLFAR